MATQRRAFTLIELLIVVAIVAILAALALPSFLAAQTRSKVSAAMANLREVTSALEMYAVDHSAYPATRAIPTTDPLGLLADNQLRCLTTPLAYTSPTSFRDPFGVVVAQAVVMPPMSGGLQPSQTDFPVLTPPNPQRALMYYHYPSLSNRLRDGRLYRNGAAAISLGPDLKDTFGAYRPFNAQTFQDWVAPLGLRSPVDTVYDPTNGTVSAGDIAGFAGNARAFSIP